MQSVTPKVRNSPEGLNGRLELEKKDSTHWNIMQHKLSKDQKVKRMDTMNRVQTISERHRYFFF